MKWDFTQWPFEWSYNSDDNIISSYYPIYDEPVDKPDKSWSSYICSFFCCFSK